MPTTFYRTSVCEMQQNLEIVGRNWIFFTRYSYVSMTKLIWNEFTLLVYGLTEYCVGLHTLMRWIDSLSPYVISGEFISIWVASKLRSLGSFCNDPLASIVQFSKLTLPMAQVWQYWGLCKPHWLSFRSHALFFFHHGKLQHCKYSWLVVCV